MNKKQIFLGLVLLCLAGLLIPQRLQMPVVGADSGSYNAQSFWAYPWGKSVTHKGVDIFAPKGTPVQAATSGIVLYAGTIKLGGNVVFVLGPKWRLHYYAHLHTIQAKTLSWLSRGDGIGTVGTSGNAAGKPPHLHYSIQTPIPYPWRLDFERQGWKKRFYLNPIEYLVR